MDKQSVIMATEEFVKEKLEGDSSGHDWWHIHRVRQMAEKIAAAEVADVWVCTMASLLHDVIDDKLVENEEDAEREVKLFLDEHGVPTKESELILEIITTISFKGGNGGPVTSKEAEIVQDADRLDAIGAIGIARTFAYSGSKGQPIYEPGFSVRDTMTVEDYRNGKSNAVHHFYEKLLQLKDRMNTNYGKKLAKQRHQRLETYLENFHSEWEGRS